MFLKSELGLKKGPKMGGVGVLACAARWCRVWWRQAPARARKGRPMRQGGGLTELGRACGSQSRARELHLRATKRGEGSARARARLKNQTRP